MKVEFYMAARARIVYHGWTTLAGALLAKDDSDDLVQAVEATFALMNGTPTLTALDVIEKQIATLVDAGAVMPISNPEAYQAAQWISQNGLEALPEPMPRGFVLYIAKALVDDGKAETINDALNTILTTKSLA